MEQFARHVADLFSGPSRVGGRLSRIWAGTTKSIARFREALAIDPKSAEAHRGLGLTFSTQDQYKEAKNHYRRRSKSIRNTWPLSSTWPRSLIEYDYKVGHRLQRTGPQDQPGSCGLEICIAMSLREQGHVDEAIRRLEKVVEETPYDPRAKQELEQTAMQPGAAKK